MKQYTDFNDLANKSALGIEGVKRQVAALTKSIGTRQRPAVEERPDVEDSATPRHGRAKKLA
jgi:putative DNA primase/helicase